MICQTAWSHIKENIISKMFNVKYLRLMKYDAMKQYGTVEAELHSFLYRVTRWSSDSQAVGILTAFKHPIYSIRFLTQLTEPITLMKILRGFHFHFLTQQIERMKYATEPDIGRYVRKVASFDRPSE
jgi:hypothetical protein